MREQFRPYTMVLGPFTDNTVSAVALVDTGGTALKCNYISVESSATGGGAEANLTARIDVDGLTTPLANQSTAAATFGNDTSGFVGGATRGGQGYPIEFVLDDGDRANNITLQYANLDITGGSTYVILTYGQVWTGNPIRDGNRPKGS